MEKSEKILKDINLVLFPQGYKLTKIYENNYWVYEFRKKYNHSINNISFLEKNDIISGFYYGINFIEMENIIIPILTKNNLFGNVTPENIDDSFFGQKNTKYTLSDKGIEASNYLEIIKIFNLFLDNDAFPFFEKWKDLSVLYEYIKDKESREELLEILGQFWQFKKAAILRLCNDNHYQSYIDNLVKRREAILALRPESVDVQRYYNASKELKEILDKTEPLYNIGNVSEKLV